MKNLQKISKFLTVLLIGFFASFSIIYATALYNWEEIRDKDWSADDTLTADNFDIIVEKIAEFNGINNFLGIFNIVVDKVKELEEKFANFFDSDGNMKLTNNLEIAGNTIKTVYAWAGWMEDGTDNGPLTGRTINFIKTQDDTGVRVAWSDNFRVGTYGNCTWEILFKGQSCANPGPIMFSLNSGVSPSNTHIPASVFGTCFGLPKGTITINTRVITPTPGSDSSYAGDCYTGWQTLSTLEAEEIRYK